MTRTTRAVEYQGGPHDGRRVMLAGGAREIHVAMLSRPTAIAESGPLDAVELRTGTYLEQLTREGILMVWQGER